MSACERILLLADIHAVRDALVRVIRDAQQRYKADSPLRIWFLGDLFGRGPDPIATWRWLDQNKPEASVAGNHDWGVIGRLQTIQIAAEWDGDFNPETDWPIILKHRQDLANVGLLNLADGRQPQGQIPENLAAWPLVCSPRSGIYLVHGGADWPLEAQGKTCPLGNSLDHYGWGYVKGPEDARYTLRWLHWLYTTSAPGVAAMPTGHPLQMPCLAIVGHYHRRVLYCEEQGNPLWEAPVQLDCEYDLHPGPTHPVLLSPGSVGFPREDRDRDAGYAVLRLEDGSACSVTFHKVPFERASVCAQMKKKGYPQKVIRYLTMPGEAAHETIDCRSA